MMQKTFSKTYYLSAGLCNPQGELPLPVLIGNVIDVATLHANSWGVGYARLIADGHAWVLSRVTVEMLRYPTVDTHYTLTTWIEDYNRHFSQRNMAITDEQGNTLGYVRTIWLVIDLSSRTLADISQLSYIRSNVVDLPCPIEPQSRLRPVTHPTRQSTHTFGYVDCDFNRHVNTIRYVEMLLNQFTLSDFDNNIIHRFEIAFLKEAHYGEVAVVNVDSRTGTDVSLSVVAGDVERLRARIIFAPRDRH